MTGEIYLTPAEVSARYNGTIKVKTLANWRSSREAKAGPPYIRAGGRIMYPFSLLLKWERERCYTSTKDYGRPPEDGEA